ncbi:MAG TPA: hypothetical protein VEL79_21490, partial [Vicinamibacterales bacterium]|nr:hypothetical protein [Vicinamibacterales bacterium]
MRASSAAAAVALLLVSVRPRGQAPVEAVDLDAIGWIRTEAYAHSHVMETARELTDVIGPRLTNSPNLRRAQRYAVDRLLAWGIGHAHLERWGPFGRGWTFDGIEASLRSPAVAPLIAYPKAWSAGTPGPIESMPVLFDVKTPADLARYRGQLRGRIVLFSPERTIGPPVLPRRMSDADLLALAGAQPRDAVPMFQPTPE